VQVLRRIIASESQRTIARIILLVVVIYDVLVALSRAHRDSARRNDATRTI
jgi:ABC-type protease/lipase transport system fused ATPase/permease subunit